MRQINRIVVHCSATPEGRDVTAADIRRWHKERGWRDIGYHAVVRLDGSIEPGRDLDNDGGTEEHVGAHTYGLNADSLGICYVGGVDKDMRPKDTRTAAQNKALVGKAREWMDRFDIPIERVTGHYEHDSGKACPSFDMDEFRAELIDTLRPVEAKPEAQAEASPLVHVLRWLADLLDNGK